MVAGTLTPKNVTVRLTNSAERWVRKEHPWLYAESLRSVGRGAEAGDIAVIYDRKGELLALGLYDPSSPIRVRVLHRGEARAIDASFFAERIRAAAALREALPDQGSSGYRVVNGEGDELPGLVLDRYDRTFVLKLYTRAWLRHLQALLDAIARVLAPERVVLRLARSIEGAGLADGAILSGPPLVDPVVFRENGLRFRCDPVRGQKTGFFLDQRENRARVGERARGRRVLNAFAYTGGFSVYAAHGGAERVVSLDVSRPALEEALETFRLNADSPGVARAAHEVVCDDAFHALAAFARQGRRFELVVIDPPAFAKARREVAGALDAYARLAELGARLLADSAELVLASCTARVDADALARAIELGAARAGRRLRETRRTGHALDHPVRFREGAYLKCIYCATD